MAMGCGLKAFSLGSEVMNSRLKLMGLVAYSNRNGALFIRIGTNLIRYAMKGRGTVPTGTVVVK